MQLLKILSKKVAHKSCPCVEKLGEYVGFISCFNHGACNYWIWTKRSNVIMRIGRICWFHMKNKLCRFPVLLKKVAIGPCVVQRNSFGKFKSCWELLTGNLLVLLTHVGKKIDRSSVLVHHLPFPYPDSQKKWKNNHCHLFGNQYYGGVSLTFLFYFYSHITEINDTQKTI